MTVLAHMPWSLEVGDHTHRFVLIKDADDRTVHYKYGSGTAKEAAIDVANARLIASAPQLLEALRALISAVTYAAPPQNYGPETDPNLCFVARVPVAFVDEARAAISLATGTEGV